jgi:protein SCO1
MHYYQAKNSTLGDIIIKTSEKNSKKLTNSWRKPVFVLTFMFGAAAVICSYWLTNNAESSSTPRVFGPGLAASPSGINFIDQNGKPFNTASMTNNIWLVNFFFTSCSGPCPLMTSQIKGIMELNKDVHTLSISTDPDVDTPPILKIYGEKFKADPSRWFFTRADGATLMNFGQQILKLPVGEQPDAHSTRIVLLDGQGKIRGWYDSQDPKTRSTILRDIAALQVTSSQMARH